VWNGHSCPLPLTLILTFDFAFALDLDFDDFARVEREILPACL
jgi:hypothetical protein